MGRGWFQQEVERTRQRELARGRALAAKDAANDRLYYDRLGRHVLEVELAIANGIAALLGSTTTETGASKRQVVELQAEVARLNKIISDYQAGITAATAAVKANTAKFEAVLKP